MAAKRPEILPGTWTGGPMDRQAHGLSPPGCSRFSLAAHIASCAPASLGAAVRGRLAAEPVLGGR